MLGHMIIVIRSTTTGLAKNQFASEGSPHWSFLLILFIVWPKSKRCLIADAIFLPATRSQQRVAALTSGGNPSRDPPSRHLERKKIQPQFARHTVNLFRAAAAVVDLGY